MKTEKTVRLVIEGVRPCVERMLRIKAAKRGCKSLAEGIRAQWDEEYEAWENNNTQTSVTENKPLAGDTD